MKDPPDINSDKFANLLEKLDLTENFT